MGYVVRLALVANELRDTAAVFEVLDCKHSGGEFFLGAVTRFGV